MNRLAAAIAVLMIGATAFAADMPVKAPSPAPVPVYNWSGWYAGVNLGASFGNVKTDYNGTPGTITVSFNEPPGGPVTGSATGSIKGFAGSDTPKWFHGWRSNRPQLAGLPYLGRGA